MPVNKRQVAQVVDSPAFDAVFTEYEGQIFEQWIACNDDAELVRLHMKASVAREVKQQLKNTVVSFNGTSDAA